MSAPVSHDPIVVQTGDGAVWRRAAVTVAGRGLYVLDGVAGCPREVMATLPELAVFGVRVPDELAVAVAALGALPMPAGSASVVPVALTEQQIDALIGAGNAALGSYYHERACACSEYPAGCATNPLYAAAVGYWDTDAFAIGMSAVLALWESMRTPVATAEMDRLSDELTGANLSSWEDGREIDRLRLALASAKRGRATARAELFGEQAQHRTTVEQRNEHVQELIRLRERVAELEAYPLAWTDALDAKSLDNFLITLGTATEYEPMDGAIAQIHQTLTQWRELVASKAEGSHEQPAPAALSPTAAYRTALYDAAEVAHAEGERLYAEADVEEAKAAWGIEVLLRRMADARETAAPSRDLRPGAEAARRMIRDSQADTGRSCIRCGEGLDEENISDFCSEACAATPAPGELAEQRHLMDPLDHTLTHLADGGVS